MKTSLLALALTLAVASPALACTAEDVQAKAQELATKVQELAAKDPQKAGEFAQKMSSAQTATVTDMEGACKLYDELLAELD